MSALPKITTEEEALAVLAEVARVSQEPPRDFIDENFPKQAAFLRDSSKLKAAKCTRRAGKSFGIGRALYMEAFNYPGTSCLYLGLTKATCKNIMWKDVMKPLNKLLRLDASFNETTLTTKLPNGSEIYLVGADADSDEMEKVLGGKYRIVVVDEAGSFRIDLRKLIYENLEPALVDWNGYAVLGGTPTEITHGLFFDVTRDTGDREMGWSVHEWNTTENPYMAVEWAKRLTLLKERNPRVEETPAYRRMYLGEWVTDLDDLVYKFKEGLNEAPELPKGEWVYVLGVDLGFSPDPSAFVVHAYNPNDTTLYVVEAYSKTEMTISDVAERIRYYQSRFPIYKIIVDNAAKQSVEELKQRFKLPLEAAEKQGKAEFIEIMNSEFIQGRIKLLPAAAPLSEEYLSLVWDKRQREKTGKREELSGCANHCADAALYAWRHCYQYLSEAKLANRMTDEEKVEKWADEQAERDEQAKKQAFWERM